MATEEIVTALRNAIDHGESLQEAIQILLNSGYSSKEVLEASNYVGGGVLANHQMRPEEQLTMPNEKKMFTKPSFSSYSENYSKDYSVAQKNSEQNPYVQQYSQQLAQQQNSPVQQLPAPAQQRFSQQSQQIRNAISQPMAPPQFPHQNKNQSFPEPRIRAGELSRELEKIKPKSQGYTKEIILLVILLILVTILGATFFLRETIIGWFA